MSFLETLKNEFLAFLKNKSVILVCLIGPIVYLFLYPTPYLSNTVTKQKIALIDNDQTHSSRQLAFFADATPDINIIYDLSSMNQAKKLLEEGEIFGILYIPKDFEKRLLLQNNPSISFLANSSYFLIYGAIINGLHNSSTQLNDYIKSKRNSISGNFSINQKITIEEQNDLLSQRQIALFNTSLGYINYALAAVFVVILHQMLIVGMGVFGTQRGPTKQPPTKTILARVFLFSAIAIVLFLFYFGTGFCIYNVAHSASIIDFWCFSLAFIFATTSFGAMLGALFSQPQRVAQTILISSLPLVFLMGFIWPSFEISGPINFIASFIPVYHGVNGLLRLNEMGADFIDIWGYFVDLILLGIMYISIAILAIRYRQKSIL